MMLLSGERTGASGERSRGGVARGRCESSRGGNDKEGERDESATGGKGAITFTGGIVRIPMGVRVALSPLPSPPHFNMNPISP